MVKFCKQDTTDALTVNIKTDYLKGKYIQGYIDRYNVPFVLEQFRKTKSQKQEFFPLIDANMYAKATDEFIRYGTFLYFPHKHVFRWIGILMKNTAILLSNTILFGRGNHIPVDECNKWIDENCQDCKKTKDWNSIFKILCGIGLYSWMKLTDGSTAVSDFAIKPILDILSEYNEDTSAEDAFVIVNKCLDITHQRGDLSLIFIQGGRKTLDEISK